MFCDTQSTDTEAKSEGFRAQVSAQHPPREHRNPQGSGHVVISAGAVRALWQAQLPWTGFS